jgi:hypothetical protein
MRKETFTDHHHYRWPRSNADDITKPLLCKYFNGKLVINEQVLKHIEYLFEHSFQTAMPLLERNRKQAEVPDICTVLMNERGTAPGMWFEAGKPEKLNYRIHEPPLRGRRLSLFHCRCTI